ncbi:MAG: DUF302 domain-containing protein [Elusimicrobia bacterium]|nr:DUF302 domain-containing protein [Elusimicrobiota bacterium]
MTFCFISVCIILFAAFLLRESFLNIMIKEFPSAYGYEETINIIKERISNKKGWHLFGVIDQGSEIVANGGSPVGRIAIIHYCHGGFASMMFSADSRKKISVFSPKAVSVYEKKDGKTYIAMMNGGLMKLLSSGEMREIVKAVSREVKEIFVVLHKKEQNLS